MVAAVRADTHLAKVKTATGFDRVSSASVMEAKPEDNCRCLNIATEGAKSAQTPRERDIARAAVRQQLQSCPTCSPTPILCFKSMSALETDHCKYSATQ